MTRLKLDPWIEGYLSYLSDVRRMNSRTIIDIRCTLKKACEFMAMDNAGRPLWKLPLDAYVRWLDHQRDKGNSPTGMAKQLSHIRGLLDYSWRSGRSESSTGTWRGSRACPAP